MFDFRVFMWSIVEQFECGVKYYGLREARKHKDFEGGGGSLTVYYYSTVVSTSASRSKRIASGNFL